MISGQMLQCHNVSDVPVSTIKGLMRIEKVNGDPLPESLMNPQQLNVFVFNMWRTTISYGIVKFL